jgi:hypothetical protein
VWPVSTHSAEKLGGQTPFVGSNLCPFELGSKTVQLIFATMVVSCRKSANMSQMNKSQRMALMDGSLCRCPPGDVNLYSLGFKLRRYSCSGLAAARTRMTALEIPYGRDRMEE